MAAHILNMLKDLQTGHYTLGQIKHAMEFTAAGDDIEFNEWTDITHAESIPEVIAIIHFILPKYEKLWKLLNEPRTQEEWHEMYFHGVKTVRKHAVRELKYSNVYNRVWDSDRKCAKPDIAY